MVSKSYIKSLILLLSLILVGISISYLAVPLYQMFCQKTGYGGTIRHENSIPTVDDHINDTIYIKFDATTDPSLQVEFKPQTPIMKVHLNETNLAFYIVKNLTNQEIQGISTFNLTPYQAGPYFIKIQCFCFDEQRWAPNEIIEMPILFYIDKDIRNETNINNITLHYTLFPVGM